MRTVCEVPWRRRLSLRLQHAVTFSGDDLVLGCGTVLLRGLGAGSSTSMLRADAGHDRMVALLTVAGRGRLAKAALLQLDAALNDWRRGDLALAAIRLAFAQLPRIRDLEDAHTLFLGETVLDAGLSPNGLIKELGYANCLPLLRFDPSQPRVSAGSGRRSGQWTSDAPGVSFAPEPTQAALAPDGDTDKTLKPIPVFLPQEGGDAWSPKDEGGKSTIVFRAKPRPNELLTCLTI